MDAGQDTNNRSTVITINNTINLMLTGIKFSDFIKIAKNRKIKYVQTIVSLRYLFKVHVHVVYPLSFHNNNKYSWTLRHSISAIDRASFDGAV